MYLIDRFSQLLVVLCKGFQNPLSGTRVDFACGIRNPLALDSGIQLKESGILLRIGIQNPRFH